MYCVVLCGGLSTRLQNYSLPKPLNFIEGKPFVHYFFQTLPATITNVIFIYNTMLEENYNFESFIQHYSKKDIQLTFQKLPYVSRGAIESAYIGLESLDLDESKPIMFLDNDNLQDFASIDFNTVRNAFLGYNIDTSDRASFSFIQFSESNQLTAIEEKKKISNFYNVGIYGFQSVNQFKSIASEFLSELHTTEFYLSGLYKLLLHKNETVQTFYIPESKHFGTYDEIVLNSHLISKPHLRICFDLDNTLVTYPYVTGDYTTVKPIEKNIKLLQKLKAEGHTIIIYTARRMATHKHNVGAVMKDIARITFATLELFNIEYDEIIFGKPIADIYIDDRAVNPLHQSLTFFGKELIAQDNKDMTIINKLPNNKYNQLHLQSSRSLMKEGPLQYMRNEAFYYQKISNEHDIREYFPTFYSYTEKNNKGCLEIEYKKGVPFFRLMKNKVLFPKHIELLFDFLHTLHSKKNISDIGLSKNMIRKNYIDKLEKRYTDTTLYNYEELDDFKQDIFSYLNDYVESDRCRVVPFIHGDFWFSNMMYTFDNKFCCFDMRGVIDTFQTTGGDPLYDYAKLLQSILGFDFLLYDEPLCKEYSIYLLSIYKKLLEKTNIQFLDVFIISLSLISGTLHAIEKKEIRDVIWNWVICLWKEKTIYLNAK